MHMLVTHVETTAAPVSDDARTAAIHAGLNRKGLLPTEHIVDTGYVDAKLLVESQRDYQINLVGPTRRNHQWQASQQKGFDADHFLIDWEYEQALCPQGHTSSSWTPAIDNRKNEVIKIKFSTTDCQVCPSRSQCTQSIRHTRRTITIRPQEQYLALKQRREQEKTKEFTQIYAKRADPSPCCAVRSILLRSCSVGYCVAMVFLFLSLLLTPCAKCPFSCVRDVQLRAISKSSCALYAEYSAPPRKSSRWAAFSRWGLSQ